MSWVPIHEKNVRDISKEPKGRGVGGWGLGAAGADVTQAGSGLLPAGCIFWGKLVAALRAMHLIGVVHRQRRKA
jgi:hypothetical protein